MIDKTACPAFEVCFFGCDRQGEERLGQSAGTMLQDDIPAFLVEVGREAAASGLPYASWEKENREKLLEIAGKYTAQAARFKTSVLRGAVRRCVEAEEAVKTGRMNDILSVELLILSVL